mmetsp:Transcript_24995/g.64506  ORF Transcript_24995/g.64506 Transcript_24995/m.64506 type:complete len:206 (+) Transcript_24995:1384-2001(+)
MPCRRMGLMAASWCTCAAKGTTYSAGSVLTTRALSMPISTSPATLEPADLTQGSPRPPPSSASQMPSTSPDLSSRYRAPVWPASRSLLSSADQAMHVNCSGPTVPLLSNTTLLLKRCICCGMLAVRLAPVVLVAVPCSVPALTLSKGSTHTDCLFPGSKKAHRSPLGDTAAWAAAPAAASEVVAACSRIRDPSCSKWGAGLPIFD